jgi:hypothetical protein
VYGKITHVQSSLACIELLFSWLKLLPSACDRHCSFGWWQLWVYNRGNGSWSFTWNRQCGTSLQYFQTCKVCRKAAMVDGAFC